MSDLTSMIGSTDANAAVVLALASSAIVNVFAMITFSRTFVINASVSISTLAEVSVNSFSTSSDKALK